MNDFEYNDENPQHRAALAMAILALEAEDLTQYPSECELTPEGHAKVMAALVGGCLEGAHGNPIRAVPIYREIAGGVN